MMRAGNPLVWVVGFTVALILAVPVAGAGARELAGGDVFPPTRPESFPAFRIPDNGERLDESWSYQQTLIDADSAYPQYFNAVPVGMVFTREGRGFLAMLHTVFRTTNGGQQWINMDLRPPPFGQNSNFQTLRSPTFISGIAARPGSSGLISGDSLLLTTVNGSADRGTVRVIFYLFNYILLPESLLTAPNWLTGVVIPDTQRALVFAGLDGAIYENRTLRQTPFSWNLMDPDKVILRDGRRDSLRLVDTWTSGFSGIDSLVIAVGSHQWISRDGGRHWRIQRAADPLHDNAVSFCDTLHGITGGGQLTPAPAGWIRRTTDGARSWQGRSLLTDMPIRAVLMVTPQIAYAAGGNVAQSRGAVWRSSDGGLTWNQELIANAEIRCLASLRFNAQYVDVVAAGFFPDFRTGIWKTRIAIPDTNSAVILEAEPDTINFGFVAPGVRVSRQFIVRNRGSAADTLWSLTGTSSIFQLPGFSTGRALPPGDSVLYTVSFGASQQTTHSTAIQIQGGSGQRIEVYCFGTVGVTAARESGASVPEELSLAIYPNPGNSLFQIRFSLPRNARTLVKVFTVDGRFVHTLADQEFQSGSHELVWDAEAQAAGVYFVRLVTAGGATRTEKLLLIR